MAELHMEPLKLQVSADLASGLELRERPRASLWKARHVAHRVGEVAVDWTFGSGVLRGVNRQD